MKHAPIKLASSLLLFSLFAACGTMRDWRELQTDPMTIGACYDGIDFIATHGGFRGDASASDRGLGTWQSRWRHREKERHVPIRNRLIFEIMVDDGSSAEGWLVRYVIEQEKIVDMRRHRDPREEDWSDDGQDSEKETILGERLVRRLAPKGMMAAEEEEQARR